MHMPKYIKMHTINITNDIFDISNECLERYSPNAGLRRPNSLNKKLKYNYTKNNCKSISKPKPKESTELSQKRPQTAKNQYLKQRSLNERKLRIIHQTRNSALKGQVVSKSNKIRCPARQNDSRNSQRIVTQKLAIEQDKNEFKRQIQDYQLQEKDQIMKRRITNKSNSLVDGQYDHSRAKGRAIHQKNLIFDKFHNRNNNRQQFSKAKNANRTYFTNSIISSYKITTIELANPLERDRKKYLLNTSNNTLSTYHIDFGDQSNLKEIYFEDIERIQLHKLKIDHRRSNSHLCSRKKRPLTSKPEKYEDFDPQPWQAEEKGSIQLFAKDAIA